MSEKMDIDANPKKDEDIKKEFQQNVIINCKFEGVFEADKNKSLLEDYKNLVNLCRNKINEFEEISFSKEETKNIFYINDDMIDSCKANEELSFLTCTPSKLPLPMTTIFIFLSIARNKSLFFSKSILVVNIWVNEYVCASCWISCKDLMPITFSRKPSDTCAII